MNIPSTTIPNAHSPTALCDTLFVTLIAQIIGVSVLFDLRFCFKCNRAFLESQLIIGFIDANQRS